MAYNNASLRVSDKNPKTVDWIGILQLVFPTGTLRSLGHGAVLVNVMPAAGFGGPQMAIGEVPSGTIDGSNAVFTIAHTPSGGLMLWRSYVLMFPGVHYNLAGVTITYTAGNEPAVGDAHMVLYQYT